jgi:hypothetical protein
MWAEPAGDTRLLRNSRAQVWLFLALTLVAFGGAFALLTVAANAGLYVVPRIAQLARGTFDHLDAIFLIMWAWTFQSLSMNDGLHYQLLLRKAHPPRSRASDVFGFAGFSIVAILWGVLAVHTVFAARAVDPAYVNRLPSGVPADSLQHGVVEVTATYFVSVGLVLVLNLIARLFNPVDFNEYERYARRILHILHLSPRKPVR